MLPLVTPGPTCYEARGIVEYRFEGGTRQCRQARVVVRFVPRRSDEDVTSPPLRKEGLDAVTGALSRSLRGVLVPGPVEPILSQGRERPLFLLSRLC